MDFNNFFNISEFAKISGLSRKTLIYYDRIGLFSPAFVADNKYRKYSRNQIESITVISILADLGVPLKEIKRFITDVSPQNTADILNKQLNAISDKIKKLSALNDMLSLRIDSLAEGTSKKDELCKFDIVDVTAPVPFFVKKILPCKQTEIPDEVMIDYFKTIEKKDLPMIFAMGYLKSWESVKDGEFEKTFALGFRLKNEKFANSFMPVGEYVVGYGKGDYGHVNDAYTALTDFLRANNLCGDGDVYEEYLIDELAEKHPKDFIYRISVRVKPNH